MSGPLARGCHPRTRDLQAHEEGIRHDIRIAGS